MRNINWLSTNRVSHCLVWISVLLNYLEQLCLIIKCEWFDVEFSVYI
jgi:hypothetical protein